MKIDVSEIRKRNTFESGKNNRRTSIFGFLNQDINIGRRKINDVKKERLYSQLNVLLSSGVDLGSALEILLEENQNTAQKKILIQVFENVVNGNSLSKSLKNTEQFSDYEYYSIKVGEESGRLQDVLKELSIFFELKIQQRRQLKGALSYPVLVSIVAVSAVIFMLNVVVPMFAGVFQRFGGELPLITQKILALSDWFSANLIKLLIVIIIFTIVLLYLRKYSWYKEYIGKLVLKLPFLGRFISRLMHARYCHSIALLSSTQVPLLDSLAMVSKMISFYPFKIAITKIREGILKGQNLFEAMQQQSIFEQRLIALTKVGEEVNRVAKIYEKLYQQYTEEVKHMTSVLGNLLEPIMIVIVGILVMVILIAMYLPLFQLSTTVM